MEYKIVLICLFGVLNTVTAQLRCYACSFSTVDTDQSCLTITNSTPSVDCRFTYCTIMRQEFITTLNKRGSKIWDKNKKGINTAATKANGKGNYIFVGFEFDTVCLAKNDPMGVVASFTRGCEDSPDYLNHEVIDPTFKTYYRACTNDLCNIGNGIQSIVGGSLSPTPEYNGLNLLVPGTGKGTNLQINLLLFINALSIYILNI